MNPLTSKLKELKNLNVWRRFTNFWSLIFFAATIYDFFKENFLSHNEILLAIAAIYCASLAIYSAEKEFRRWHHNHDSIHPGEAYVIIWTFLVIFLIVGDTIFKVQYHMPPEVSASYIAVISILALTRESRSFFKKKDKKTSSVNQ